MDNLHDQFKGYHTGISAKSLNLFKKELGGLVCARGLDWSWPQKSMSFQSRDIGGAKNSDICYTCKLEAKGDGKDCLSYECPKFKPSHKR